MKKPRFFGSNAEGFTPSLSISATVSTARVSTRAGFALVRLATDGSGSIGLLNGSAGTLHFVLDVNGYFQ